MPFFVIQAHRWAVMLKMVVIVLAKPSHDLLRNHTMKQPEYSYQWSVLLLDAALPVEPSTLNPKPLAMYVMLQDVLGTLRYIHQACFRSALLPQRVCRVAHFLLLLLLLLLCSSCCQNSNAKTANNRQHLNRYVV